MTTAISAADALLLQTSWILALALATLGILWNARSAAVYLWCLGSVLGALAVWLLFGPLAETLYSANWRQTVLGFVIVAAAWSRVISIRLTVAKNDFKGLLPIGGVMAVTLLALPLTGLSRPISSLLIACYLGGLMLWLALDAFRFSKTERLLNGKVFAVVTGLQAINIMATSLLATTSGIDPLAPIVAPLPVGAVIYSLVLHVLNVTLYIALVMDIRLRQAKRLRHQLLATEVERSRLLERERLLADMHDGLGSQLISAKLKAEQGQLQQPEMVELLRECMADLHLLIDGLKGQPDGLGAVLKQFRNRTERRLAGQPLLLLWHINLDDAPPLAPKETIHVLRIIQESLNNALKHSQAQKIVITARYTADSNLLVRIEDDGLGLPSDVMQSHGLQGMRRRAREIGASLSIARGNDDRGTVVELLYRVPQPCESAAA